MKYFFVYRGFYGVMIHIALFLMLCCCAMVLKIIYERIAIFLGAAGALFYGLSPLFFLKLKMVKLGITSIVLGILSLVLAVIFLFLNLKRFRGS